MDRRRLPATLQVNRSDIQSLNERANLIKIIGNRKNALQKREELMGEYNEIMKRLHKSQLKKKARLRAGRGGVRTSRAHERRQEERFKRGERRGAGKDEPEIIGEEIKKDAQGNLQITYRDYNAERQAQAEKDIQRILDLDRLDNIRREDIQLRFDERARDRDDRILRDRENVRLQREFRDRDDAFKDFQIQREDGKDALNRLIEGRRLDIADGAMANGADFYNALLGLDERLNRRFDAADAQFRNLLQTNPNGVEIEDLRNSNPDLIDTPALDELEAVLSEPAEEVVIPIEEEEPEEELPVARTPRTPKRIIPDVIEEAEAPRPYAPDLTPVKEVRQPRGKKRSYKEDLEIISKFLEIPPEGTPERVAFDNDYTSGDLDGVIELIAAEPLGETGLAGMKIKTPSGNFYGVTKPGELETLKEKAKAERAIVDADKQRVAELQVSVDKDKVSKLDQSLESMRQIAFEPEIQDPDNPLGTFLNLERQRTIDSLIPGLNYTDLKGDVIGYNNPQSTPEELAEFRKQQEKEGLVTIGTQQAIQAGVQQSPRPPAISTKETLQDLPLDIGDEIEKLNKIKVSDAEFEGIFDAGFLESDNLQDAQENHRDSIFRDNPASDSDNEYIDDDGDVDFEKVDADIDKDQRESFNAVKSRLNPDDFTTYKTLARETIREYSGLDADDVIHNFETDVDARDDIPSPLRLSPASSSQEEDDPSGSESTPDFNLTESSESQSSPSGSEQSTPPAPAPAPPANKGTRWLPRNERDETYYDNNSTSSESSVESTESDEPPSEEEQPEVKPGKFIKAPSSSEEDEPSVEESVAQITKKLREPLPPVDPKKKFIPDKYKKDQDVMYFRAKSEGNVAGWRPAKIVEYKDDEGEASITIQRTTGSVKDKNTPVETGYEKVVSLPTDEERLIQEDLKKQLKESLKPEGVAKVADARRYVVHNETGIDFRGIAPGGKSLIRHHKKGKPDTYMHTPMDDDDKLVLQTGGYSKNYKQLSSKFLHDGMDNGLVRVERLDKPLPFEDDSSESDDEEI